MLQSLLKSQAGVLVDVGDRCAMPAFFTHHKIPGTAQKRAYKLYQDWWQFTEMIHLNICWTIKVSIAELNYRVCDVEVESSCYAAHMIQKRVRCRKRP